CDGYFGNVRALQREKFGAEIGADLTNPDFVALATAFDVPATRVDSPHALGAEIRRSLTENGPVLIEVTVGEMPSPWRLLRLVPMQRSASAPPNPLRRTI